MNIDQIEEFGRLIRDGHRIECSSDPYWYTVERRTYPNQYRVIISENHDGEVRRFCIEYGATLGEAWDNAYLVFGQMCLNFEKHGVPVNLSERFKLRNQPQPIC